MKLRHLIVIALATLTPFILGATSPHLISGIRTMTTSVTQPILEFQTQCTSWFVRQWNLLTEIPKLKSENELLKEHVSHLEQQLTALPDLEKELKRLTDLLKLKRETKGATVSALVIGRDPSHWSHYVMINKGETDHVRQDTILVHPTGLVGKVTMAGPYSARAILITDMESRVSSMNQRTRDVGLIEGTGTMMLKMTFLDRKADIKVGDLIISSGLGGIYPKGVPIGRVTLVGENKNDLMLYAMVKPLVPLSKVEEVLCLTSS